MISKDRQGGFDAENAPGLNDCRAQPSGHQTRRDEAADVSGQLTGRNEAADDLNCDIAEPPADWKSVRLEPQISQLLDTMEDAVVAHDSGVIIAFNKRVPELLGCPADRILWRRLSKFIEPVSLPTLARWIDAADHYTILVNGIRPDGGPLLLRLEAVASLVYPGGRRIEIAALIEFAPAAGNPPSVA